MPQRTTIPKNQPKIAEPTPDVQAHWPTLYIDRREPVNHPIIVADVKRELPMKTEIKHMDFGDYAWAANHLRDGSPIMVGLELCTVSDLIEKVNTGRLSYQLGNMLKTYDVSYLFVESTPVADRDGYVKIPGGVQACTFERLSYILNGAQAHGVKVIYGQGREFAGHHLAQIYRYWQRDPESHKFFRPVPVLRSDFNIPLGESLDVRVLTAMSIPGVGEQRARDALLSLGSLMAFFLAGEDRLAKIPGWGPVTARKVWQYITRSMSDDITDLLG